MDKKPVIGFILIGILLTIWMVTQTTQRRPVPPPDQQTQETLDLQDESLAADLGEDDDAFTSAEEDPTADYGDQLRAHAQGSAAMLTIESGLYRVVLNPKGGVFREWYLKEFENWQGDAVQLVPYKEETGVFGVSFSTREARNVDTRNLYFELEYPQKERSNHLQLRGGDSVRVRARLRLESGAELVKTYTFYADKYHIKARIGLNKLNDLIFNRSYTLAWESGLPYQERNSVEESSYAKALMQLGGEEISLDAGDFDKTLTEKSSGAIDFAAIKNKYFVAAVKPLDLSAESSVQLKGTRRKAPNEGVVEQYSLQYRIPYRQPQQEYDFLLYVGPLDYDIVQSYGLEKTVDFGWGPIRVVGEYFMLPIFQAVHAVVPNYGFSIIVFAFLIKLMLMPLSMPQTKSSIKMQLLAPEMNKLREQNKDDPRAQQQAMMQLYSQYGVNPVGGCLPLLLQMPILYALWSLFQSAIALRQTHFFGWITDLSVPDVLLALPFKLPLLGLNHISGLALIMGITLFIQQKMTVTDPRQKGIVYIMPFMFTILFSNFPAGLNLYYLVFNLLGIGQQVYMQKFSKNKMTLEDLKKMPKKEGWLQRKMQEAQSIAAEQGRSLPGQPYPTNPNKRKRKKKRRK